MPQTSSAPFPPAGKRPLPVVRMGLLLWLLGLPGIVTLVWGAPAPRFLLSLSRSSDLWASWGMTAGLSALLALVVWLGLTLGRQVGLGAPLVLALVEGRIPWRGMRVLTLPGVAGGVLGAAWLVTLAVVWPESMAVVDPAYGLPLGPKMLYGAITEELLLRFGAVSVVMWLLWRVRGCRGLQPGWSLGLTAIALVALLSGTIPVLLGWSLTGSMPVASMLQLLVCESVYGVLAGVMFWRYGIEVAMLSHVVTYLLSHGLI